MIRDDIKAAQLTAMKAGDKQSRNAISLIQAAMVLRRRLMTPPTACARYRSVCSNLRART